MDDNVQRNGKNVVIDICDDSNNDDGNDKKRLDELTEEEVYQMTFDIHEDEETFYNAYAKVNGFSIRNYNMHKDNACMVKSRKWVCSKEGYRDTKYLEREDRIRGPQTLTRVGCPAVFSITLERSSGKYLVNNFVSVHNHPMIGPCGVPFLRSHRKTNAYRKPLVILAGVNIYFQTTIFGCALLTTETVETYTWVLERLLDSMDHKKPVSVMTDGDKAMRRAIKTVLPDVNHPDFEKCMSISTEEEFEVVWKNLLDDYSLHQNQWAVDVYKKKTLWAEAYLRAFDRALAKLRHKETKLQVESVNSTLGYNETKEEITKLTSRMRELYALHVEEEQRIMRQNDNIEGTSMHFGVGDPVIIKGKGTHNLAKDFIPKTRKCGNCRELGHIRTKCPKLVHGDNVGNMNEDEDTYESDVSVIHQ
ncbi:hypothetical protein RHSIM_Rhsim01G0048200 [Rhododendron simsii]|uniref:CCHC-type domain-containing protein n=1 Tax=Rhododendron simsii TaxID=118357 RepID=A0A834HG98_RHOSS|nr:hypothetical protein RHSIM_Rhsim01G0048200 [Rhododendron simsii]